MRTMMLMGLFTAATLAPGQAPKPADARAILGDWRVDLRPKPGAAEYYQPFVVTSVEGNRLEGTFYGSEIQDGRINTDWGVVHFAFVTADARERGLYNTSGRLVDGRLEGTTHSLGRDFLAVWTADRKPIAPPAPAPAPK